MEHDPQTREPRADVDEDEAGDARPAGSREGREPGGPHERPRDVEKAARATTRLDSFDIGVASGQARIILRFTAPDEYTARRTHADLLRAVAAVADVPRARLALVRAGRSAFLD
ncbi:hypothetical protein M3T53_03640 [Actinomyces sp. B33]|uniref:hypothetical protein n=1 Tax=Actinomyces sp. B33 TaxID=2942131 RepID=UPI002341578E|nr:hypothetical protein [Actinomyces sp. B33]MDC4232804.1 hypothetical protein [Actinomyces sp. B33]